MKLLRLLVTGCMMFLLAGCFQVTTVVRVNPDGSGTVEERVLLSNKIVAQIEELVRSFEDKGGKGKPFDMFQPDQLKEHARSMGKGVTYRGGEKAVTPDYTGYWATYAFSDINTLKLNQQSAPAGGTESKALPLSFRFKKGPASTLTILQPKTEPSRVAPAVPDGKPASPADVPPQMTEEKTKELLEMFMGMKFALAVEVNGTILSTNATHRDGNRLTIVDFDLGKLGNATPDELEKLSQMKGGSLEEAKELAKNIPGVAFDLNEKVTVVFEKGRP
ncbi:hypothetical protein [Geomobilimonas luticola]|uniref:Lipoprotein n=1 Tax=Geomobilimonas luticola TaxID=1114878 RepID=A0ABS5SDR8_9BACT|nr:hypothetical protein [Geomobilimonas luticola]MBT0653509.1 hypothetical protein [Geomobilimonas luticola]